ncbi:MAG TPA: ATP-binding protein [Puia sp.]|nr:ATP-binding protein [Puia sp.]
MKKMIHYICFSALLAFYLLPAFAQTQTIDSLKSILKTEKDDSNKVKTLIHLCIALWNNSDNNNALDAAKEALSVAEKLNYKRGIALSKLREGAVKATMGKFDDALSDLNVALTLYRELKDEKYIGHVYENISYVYYANGLYGEAINSQYNALKLFEKIGDKPDAANCFQGIGAYYMEEGNDSDAIKNFTISLQFRIALKDSNDIAQSLGSIAAEYTKLGNYAESIKEDSAAFKMYTELGARAYSWGKSFCKVNFGDIYKNLAEKATAQNETKIASDYYRQCLDNYNAALKFLINTKDYENIQPVDNKIGFVLIGLHRYPEAKEHFLHALKLSDSAFIKEEIKNSYNGLSIVDSANGNYKKAYEEYKKYITYRDSIINEKSTKKTVQASMQYAFDKKQAASKAEQDKKDDEAKRIKNQQYFMIAGLAIVVLAAIVIAMIQFRNNKQKQIANLLLERQKQKVESTLSDLKSTQSQLIQSEKMASLGELTAGIAHEIQNPLNFVNNFSEINKELLAELRDEADKGNMEEVKTIAKDVIDNSEKINIHGKRADAIVKGMLQHSRSSVGVQESTDINKLADEYVKLAYHGFRAKDNSFNARIKTDFDDSIEKINIIPQDLGRVLLNLYNNAFYAISEKKKQIGEGYEPTISVSTKTAENHVIITVSDNGKGIPQKVVDKIFQPFFTTKPTGQGTGLGLSLSYDIVKAHGGEIKVETKENEGSEFTISLPLK